MRCLAIFLVSVTFCTLFNNVEASKAAKIKAYAKVEIIDPSEYEYKQISLYSNIGSAINNDKFKLKNGVVFAFQENAKLQNADNDSSVFYLL